MTAFRFLHTTWLSLAVVVIAAIAPVPLHAQTSSTAEGSFRPTRQVKPIEAQGMSHEWYRKANSEISALQRRGKHWAAQEKVAALFKRVVEAFGARSFDAAIVLNRAGHIHQARKKPAAAAKSYAESVAIMREVFGPVHSQVAVVLTSLASTNGALKKLEDARRQYAEALKIAEQADGRESDAYLQVLNSFATYNANYDDEALAVRLIDDVIKLTLKVKGSTSSALLNAYKNKAALLAKQKKKSELEAFFAGLLKNAEANHGVDHTFTIQLLANFAKLYRDTRYYTLSEELYRKIIARSTSRLGPTHRFTVANFTLLADMLQNQGKNREAVTHYAVALERWGQAFGQKNTQNIQVYLRYGRSLRRIGRFADAEAAFLRSIEIGKRALGKLAIYNHYPYAGLAGLKKEIGDYEAAEKYYKEALSRARKVYGNKHHQVALTLESLATLYGEMGRHDDAEKAAGQALEQFESLYGTTSPSIVTVLNNLALVYNATNRTKEALSYLSRAMTIVNGNETMKNDPIVPVLLDNLASVFSRRGKPEIALKHTRSAYERFLPLYGKDNARTATAALNLGALHAELKQFDKALPWYQQALGSFEKIYGRRHRNYGDGLGGVARAMAGLGRLEDAMQNYRHALAVYEAVLPEGHPQIIYQLRIIAGLLKRQRDFQQAFTTYQRAENYVEARLAEGRGSPDAAEIYRGLIRTGYGIGSGREGRADLLSASFNAAQRLGGAQVAGALAKMSARFASGDDALGAIVREQQDLLDRLKIAEAKLTTALGAGGEARDQSRIDHLRSERHKTRERLTSLEERLRRDFPKYAELSKPQPLTVERLSRQLTPREIFIQYVVNGDGVFAWLVGPSRASWHRLDITQKELRRLVAILRCGLDASQWTDEKCLDLTGMVPDGSNGTILPFDLEAAHKLYEKLLAPFEARIFGRKLLIVTPDALATLPFHVLVRQPSAERFVADQAALRDVDWLAKTHPITILPAASSLGALRTYAGKSSAGLPYFGVGDPVLAGNGACPVVPVPETCEFSTPPNKSQQVAMAGSLAAFYRSGQADVAAVSGLCPLPDTAHELRCVAKSLGAAPDVLRLQAAANEASIKTLSEGGDLAQYRVVHFATHGLLAGETKSLSKGLNEPALVLTPPLQATASDDGLLTASEVAALKLDADWVILSACNTAGGGAPGREALSGLARAFFYAGSRAVLVSHWPVYSSAAVKLTTKALGAMRQDPKLGRAAAMQFSMVRLLEAGKPHEVHPAYWAPFVVVGEGG